MMEIIPAILADHATDLQEKFLFPGFWRPGMTAHIDILDGSMFGTACFCDPTAIVSPSPSPFPAIELHCMVQNPLPVIAQWKTLIPNTLRAIVHWEISRPINVLLEQIKALGIETAVALCPETSTERLQTLTYAPDRILVMGVRPGASGQSFLGEPILAKIRRLRTLYPSLIIAVDGGVTQEVIPTLHQAGANAAIMNSAIWHTTNPRRTYELYTSLWLHGQNDI